jgi:hypothetical protein
MNQPCFFWKNPPSGISLFTVDTIPAPWLSWPSGKFMMKENYSKAAFALFLAALAIGSSGCITRMTIRQASEVTDERYGVPGGKPSQHAHVDYLKRQAGGKDLTAKAVAKAKSLNNREPAHVYKHHYEYYALIPLSAAADLATSPFQVIFFLLYGGSWKC